MKLYGVVVEIMSNFIVFKLDFLKMLLIMKLGEDLKTWTGSIKSDKILGLTVWSETYEMTKFQKS